MKLPHSLFLLITPILIHLADAADPSQNTVILDEIGIKNLQIKTVMVTERDFQKTVFAIGRVEEIPGNQYAVSSRIPGRAVEMNAFIGDRVKKGQTLVKVESRQPGDPPPTIELKALRDGLVVNTHVLLGQPVEPGTELFDISNRSEMWVIAQIPEQVASGIVPGTKAHISFPALGGDPIIAELLRFGVQANRSAGAVEGVFKVPNPDEKLQPGMRAEFEIVVETRKNVLAVPEESLQGDPANRVVYVKDFELPNAFVRAPVVTGQTGAGMVEIKQGLFPGDEVVTRGSYSLGFVGNDSGISLKEALDAAHGHEHAADGSELEPGEEAEDEHDHGDHDDHGDHHIPTWLIIYAAVTSLLAIAFAQLFWNAKRRTA